MNKESLYRDRRNKQVPYESPALSFLSPKVQGVLEVERDKFFNADYPISVYARAARSKGAITEDRETLERFIKEDVED